MKLFESGSIGNLKLKNRVVMAPMGIDYIDDDFGFQNKQLTIM